MSPNPKRKPLPGWVRTVYLLGLVGGTWLGCARDRAREDSYLWLEEFQSERALEWVAEQNQRSTSSLESTTLFETLAQDAQTALAGSAHLPLAEILGDHAYGFWQDERNPRGVWRRATAASYLGGEPSWETPLDLDQLADEEGDAFSLVSKLWRRGEPLSAASSRPTAFSPATSTPRSHLGSSTRSPTSAAPSSPFSFSCRSGAASSKPAG